MLVQFAASLDTWSWNAVAYAASQVSTVWQTVTGAPRSTYIHCGSLNALAQRVPVLPSNAALAGVPAPSDDAAVAGRPCAALAVPQPPPVSKDPNTWNSHSEYPYPVARAVPYIRTYLPAPFTLSVCVPPVPVVGE